MSRMLDALRQLETRPASDAPPELPQPDAPADVSAARPAAETPDVTIPLDELSGLISLLTPPSGSSTADQPAIFLNAPADVPTEAEPEPPVEFDTLARLFGPRPREAAPLKTSPEQPLVEDKEPQPAPDEPALGEPAVFEPAALRPVAPEPATAPEEAIQPSSDPAPAAQPPREPTPIEQAATEAPPVEERETLLPAKPTPAAPPISPLEARVLQSARHLLAGQMDSFARAVMQEFAEASSATILLLGPDPCEHTALVAGSLAIWLAENTENEILLVDGDPVERHLSLGFACEQQRGLADVLNGSLGEHQSPIHRTATPRLSILPAGRRRARLGDGDLDLAPRFLTGLSERWPWIVVHGGVPEAPITAALASGCQGAYLLVRLGHTARSRAAATLVALQAAGTHVLGCVATDA